MKKIIMWAGLGIIVLGVVALVVVFFTLDSIVKKGVETLGPDITRVEVRLGSAKISPIGGSGELANLFVGNPNGYKTASAIETRGVKVSVKIGSVFSDTIVVDEVNIQAPQITLEGSLTGKNNLSAILDNVTAYGGSGQPHKTGSDASAKKSQKKFIVKDLVINGGKITLSISGLGQNFSEPVPLPTLHLHDIGTAQNGVTADQLVTAILKPLLASTTKAAADQVVNLGGKLKNLGKTGVDGLGNAVKGLKGLLHQ
jgi:uncharacterized protein involved in outer membrane biogenesis